MSPSLRNRFIKTIVKDANKKQQDNALEFHEFYTLNYRPHGAHKLIPGERDFTRRPSEVTHFTAAPNPSKAVSATCSICNQKGRLDAMRKTICDHKSSCSKHKLLQSLRDARAAWKVLAKQRRKDKVKARRGSICVASSALAPFVNTPSTFGPPVAGGPNRYGMEGP